VEKILGSHYTYRSEPLTMHSNLVFTALMCMATIKGVGKLMQYNSHSVSIAIATLNSFKCMYSHN